MGSFTCVISYCWDGDQVADVMLMYCVAGTLPKGVSSKSVEAEASLHKELAHNAILSHPISAPLMDHNDAERLPKCSSVPMKRKNSESIGYADALPSDRSAATRMLVARRPAFKCPRHKNQC